MKVYAVLAYYKYYPLSDNCFGLFSTLEKAEAFANTFDRQDYDYVEVIWYEVQ